MRSQPRDNVSILSAPDVRLRDYMGVAGISLAFEFARLGYD